MVAFTRSNKDVFIHTKLKVEILYIFYFFSLWCVSGRCPFFTVITHVVYISMKVKTVIKQR